MNLSSSFWTVRYTTGTTGWDLGKISSPLKTYVDQLTDKSIKILVPGAGNSWESEYLWKKGFSNVHVLDFAQGPLDNFKKRNPDFPDNQLIKENFFKHKGQYDLMLEQTFFCALNPDLREQYAQHLRQILKPEGKMAGVMFHFPLTEAGPPFGGSREEYQTLFSPNFTIKTNFSAF